MIPPKSMLGYVREVCTYIDDVDPVVLGAGETVNKDERCVSWSPLTALGVAQSHRTCIDVT